MLLKKTWEPVKMQERVRDDYSSEEYPSRTSKQSPVQPGPGHPPPPPNHPPPPPKCEYLMPSLITLCSNAQTCSCLIHIVKKKKKEYMKTFMEVYTLPFGKLLAAGGALIKSASV